MLMITCSSCQRKFYKSGNPNSEMPDDLNSQPNNKEATPRTAPVKLE